MILTERNFELIRSLLSPKKSGRMLSELVSAGNLVLTHCPVYGLCLATTTNVELTHAECVIVAGRTGSHMWALSTYELGDLVGVVTIDPVELRRKLF